VEAEHLHSEDGGFDRRCDEDGQTRAGNAQLREGTGAGDERVCERGVHAHRGHCRDHRAARTAGRPEDTAEQGADRGGDDGKSGEAEVPAARGGNDLGSADQSHEGLAPDQDRDRSRDTDAAGEEQRRGDGLVEPGLVPVPVGARHEDAHGRADRAQGEDQDHRQAVGEADGGDGGGAERSDDHLVDDVEDEGEDELRIHRDGDAGDLTTRDGATATAVRA
jgi:hypothetical protein